LASIHFTCSHFAAVIFPVGMQRGQRCPNYAVPGVMQGHYMLGLKVLNLLVTEFNQPTAGRTMTQHRKMAVVFRDNALFKIFQIAIAALRLLQSNVAADDKLREQVRLLH
jgi:hypothetical protein